MKECPAFQKFPIHLAWKHEEGITVIVRANTEDEAKALACKEPVAIDYLNRHPGAVPLMWRTNRPNAGQELQLQNPLPQPG